METVLQEDESPSVVLQGTAAEPIPSLLPTPKLTPKPMMTENDRPSTTSSSSSEPPPKKKDEPGNNVVHMIESSKPKDDDTATDPPPLDNSNRNFAPTTTTPTAPAPLSPTQPPPKPRAITSSSSSDDDVNILTLQERKKDLKQQLKQYDMDFTSKHGRMPTKSEKEPIRDLYEDYKATKAEIRDLLIKKKEDGTLLRLASLKAEKAQLHRMLQAYEEEFYTRNQRQVSSWEDIKPVASQYRRHKDLTKQIAAMVQQEERTVGGDPDAEVVDAAAAADDIVGTYVG